VDHDEARELLERVAAGRVPVPAALDALTVGVLGDGSGYADLGFARVDTHRALRTGDPEVVYAAGKTPGQVVAIVDRLRAADPGGAVLVTRAGGPVRAALQGIAGPIEADPLGRCVLVGTPPEPAGRVAVVCAGTSDLPIAHEALVTLRAYGAGTELVTDVGVAGLHRLIAARPVLDAADCVVAIAGMDGALPSVLGGLVGVPVVAVPTSVGYGASFGGLAPLLTMLNSCAPGVAVMNIDNGFGAGVFAARVARQVGVERARLRQNPAPAALPRMGTKP
jgi:NCAIR mutase (PurE)-related protein